MWLAGSDRSKKPSFRAAGVPNPLKGGSIPSEWCGDLISGRNQSAHRQRLIDVARPFQVRPSCAHVGYGKSRSCTSFPLKSQAVGLSGGTRNFGSRSPRSPDGRAMPVPPPRIVQQRIEDRDLPSSRGIGHHLVSVVPSIRSSQRHNRANRRFPAPLGPRRSQSAAQRLVVGIHQTARDITADIHNAIEWRAGATLNRAISNTVTALEGS